MSRHDLFRPLIVSLCAGVGDVSASGRVLSLSHICRSTATSYPLLTQYRFLVRTTIPTNFPSFLQTRFSVPGPSEVCPRPVVSSKTIPEDPLYH